MTLNYIIVKTTDNIRKNDASIVVNLAIMEFVVPDLFLLKNVSLVPEITLESAFSLPFWSKIIDIKRTQIIEYIATTYGFTDLILLYDC